MVTFDNFFAYSLAGGTAIAPPDSGSGETGQGTLIPQWDEAPDVVAVRLLFERTKPAPLVVSSH